MIEMESFVRNANDKVAAATGAWDDMVMALAIAASSSVREQAASIIRIKKKGRKRFSISSITGY